mmetsp:Transcript_8155/g.13943  ORF Transcript_8155/g.13943 Transcript_8155/m.13943 type:complete len:237 (-) Transcript_8155:179-889(-)
MQRRQPVEMQQSRSGRHLFRGTLPAICPPDRGIVHAQAQTLPHGYPAFARAMRILSTLHKWGKCAKGLGHLFRLKIARGAKYPVKETVLGTCWKHPLQYRQIQLNLTAGQHRQFRPKIAILPNELIRIDVKQPIGPCVALREIGIDRLAAHLRGRASLVPDARAPVATVARHGMATRYCPDHGVCRIVGIVKEHMDRCSTRRQMPQHIGLNQGARLANGHDHSPCGARCFGCSILV